MLVLASETGFEGMSSVRFRQLALGLILPLVTACAPKVVWNRQVDELVTLGLVEVVKTVTITIVGEDPPKDVVRYKHIQTYTKQAESAVVGGVVIPTGSPRIYSIWQVRMWSPQVWVNADRNSLPQIGSLFDCYFGKCRISQIATVARVQVLNDTSASSQRVEYWVVPDSCRRQLVKGEVLPFRDSVVLLSCPGLDEASTRHVRLKQVLQTSISKKLPR